MHSAVQGSNIRAFLITHRIFVQLFLTFVDTAKMGDELDEYLAEVLPDFDLFLAEQGVGLTQRAFRASLLVVKNCITEIKGDTKDNYLNKPWFRALFQAVDRWYDNRYGNALQQKSVSTVSAVILAFRTPFRVDVPLVVNEPHLPDGTFWVGLPATVSTDEDYMSWIINPPNFDSSNANEHGLVSSMLRETAAHLRATHVNLMTADYERGSTKALAAGILPHLEKGALDISRAEVNGRSIAVWELNFACEKAIKTFLKQRSVNPPLTHDIHRLHKLAVAQFGQNEMDSAVALLPSEKVAVKHRYAEISSPSLAETFSIYRAALTIVSGYSLNLMRKYAFNDAKFHFKSPPWLN